MMKKKCPRCNTQLIKSSNYCHRCGERVTTLPENFTAGEVPTEQELPVTVPVEEKTEEIPLSDIETSVPSGKTNSAPQRGSNSYLKIFLIVLIVVIGISIVSLCAFGGYYLFRNDLIQGLFALLYF